MSSCKPKPGNKQVLWLQKPCQKEMQIAQSKFPVLPSTMGRTPACEQRQSWEIPRQGTREQRPREPIGCHGSSPAQSFIHLCSLGLTLRLCLPWLWAQPEASFCLAWKLGKGDGVRERRRVDAPCVQEAFG